MTKKTKKIRHPIRRSKGGLLSQGTFYLRDIDREYLMRLATENGTDMSVELRRIFDEHCHVHSNKGNS